MHTFWSIALALATAGCVSQAPLKQTSGQQPAKPPLAFRQTETRLLATPYTIRGYRDPDDPTVLHDGHTVYRLTRVPDPTAIQGILPRTAIHSVTYAPLPASEELAAELATQRQITAELRQIEASMIRTQQQALTEVGKLVNQKAEAVRRQNQITSGSAKNSDDLPSDDSRAAAPPPAANW